MYKDILSVNKNFQYSVNLDFDLPNQNKLDEYIPTSDICDILLFYIDTILEPSKNRATTLVGPYGKGKSFLLLVLIQIFSKNTDEAILNNLIKKISVVNKTLAKKIQTIRSKKIFLIPIIVNSSYDNLSQSFLLGLKTSLDREKLNELIPKTSFDVCLDLLKKWETSEINKSGKLDKCLSDKNISMTNLKQGLKNCSFKSYKEFENLYNCMIDGLPFNPMTESNVVKLFSSVNHELFSHGYSGMFIIFDEFTKFIESNSPTLSADLKVLQDFAEKSTHGKSNEQLHICCITHKLLRQYLRNDIIAGKNKELFKTVEGRFKEIRFNRGLNQNYELIGATIQKKKGFDNAFNSFYKDNISFYNSIKNLSFLNCENINQALFKNCFPLNPITAFSVIALSEYIAQNERTLFTFLSDNDENSFKTFITNNNSGLFDLSKVYDYFLSMLVNSESQAFKSICLRAESCLNKINDSLDKKIIKCLAIFECLQITETIVSNNMMLSLSLFISEEIIDSHINKLVSDGVLRRNSLTSSICFAGYNSEEIDRRLNLLVTERLKNDYWPNIINSEINRRRFILPREYNANRKMTRYYYSLYIDEKQFMEIVSYKNILHNYNADGFIINVIRVNMSIEVIMKQARILSDNRVIVTASNEPFDSSFINEVKKIKAYDILLQENDAEDIIKSELEISRNEQINDLSNVIDNRFYKDACCFYSPFGKDKNFNNLLSIVMDQIYFKTPIINNELLNKDNITTQYLKPRNVIINKLLNHEELNCFSETSPETSIINSLINKKDDSSIRTVIDLIKEKIFLINGKKMGLTDIISELIQEPYGIRKGVIPILFAIAISELGENIILYFENKEVDTNAFNLSKIVDSKDKMSILVTKKTLARDKYVERLIDLFGGLKANSFIDNLKIATSRIKKFLLNLPKITRNATSNISYNTCQYKGCFLSYDINPYEVIFEKAYSIFSTHDCPKLYLFIEQFKTELDSYSTKYCLKISEQIKTYFGGKSEESLSNSLKSWLKKCGYQKGKIVMDIHFKNALNFIAANTLFDDYECVNELSNLLIGSRIEDWDSNRIDDIYKSLDSLKIAVSLSSKSNSFSELSDAVNLIDTSNLTNFGEMLQNNINSALDEFGDSITSEEKVKILANIIRKLM